MALSVLMSVFLLLDTHGTVLKHHSGVLQGYGGGGGAASDIPTKSKPGGANGRKRERGYDSYAPGSNLLCVSGKKGGGGGGGDTPAQRGKF